MHDLASQAIYTRCINTLHSVEQQPYHNMVVPHFTNPIHTSFVRVPNKDSEKGAKEILLNLGIVSTAAATVNVGQHLPVATNILKMTPNSHWPGEISVPSKILKRARTEEKKNNSDSGTAPKIIRIEASSHTAPIKNIPVQLMAAIRIPNPGVLKLREENRKLREENEQLKRQSSLLNN